MRSKSILVLVIFILNWCIAAQATVVMDWVTIGNAGNAADSTGYGALAYEYNIGKYEVTADQYCEFLNAVAKTDTYGLYSMFMCIEQHGINGSYSYSVSTDWSKRPVGNVNWYNTLRFANWLHNGQPTGDQDESTTEDGAYDMSLGSSVFRKTGALVWLPSEDEWYKAAYHKNDGVTGNYFSYPTGTDSIPSNDLLDPDPGNNATFKSGQDYTIGSPYYRTEVGAHENSESPYDTFDMGGNVWEWNEAVITLSNHRCARGGSFTDDGFALNSSMRREFNTSLSPNYQPHSCCLTPMVGKN